MIGKQVGDVEIIKLKQFDGGGELTTPQHLIGCPDRVGSRSKFL